MNDLLPVGSIVKIRFDQAKYCIIGFYTKDPVTGKVYDYTAVKYPFGIEDIDNLVGFESKRIKEVVQRGYETEEDKSFRQEIYEEVKGKQGKAEFVSVSPVHPIEKLEE